MGGAFDGVGEGYKPPTFRGVITAFVLIMAAVALVWIVWTNLVLQQKDAGAELSPAPGVQQVHYPADPVDIR